MSVMVERGARAAMAKVRETSDEVLDPDHYRMLARAVIAVMREPTEAMIEAATARTDFTGGDFLNLWEAAIDEALK